MPTVQDTAKLLDLKRRIDKMSPGDRLRVAAGLIDKGEYDIAETLAGYVVDGLAAVRILRNARPSATNTNAVAAPVEGSRTEGRERRSDV